MLTKQYWIKNFSRGLTILTLFRLHRLSTVHSFQSNQFLAYSACIFCVSSVKITWLAVYRQLTARRTKYAHHAILMFPACLLFLDITILTLFYCSACINCPPSISSGRVNKMLSSVMPRVRILVPIRMIVVGIGSKSTAVQRYCFLDTWFRQIWFGWIQVLRLT